MVSVGGFRVGLSVVLSLLVFALVAELFYFLWWKRKTAELEVDDGDGGKCGNKISRLLRWKSSSTSSSTSRTLNHRNESALEQGIYSDDSQAKIVEEETVESELKRVHNLTVPHRFLFTIEEETNEDMAEAEDGKSIGERRRKGSRSRSLGDALMAVELPVLTTPSSSPLKVSALNPLFEADSEVYSLRSSPPPTFKFLRDAEDKFIRKLTEAAQRNSAAESSTMVS